MKTLGSHAGFFEIDHRESPGLTPEQVAQVPGAVAVPGGQLFQRDIKQCTHCQRPVMLNPGRVRDRAVCPSCHHYICDGCDALRRATGECVPFKAVLDRAAEITEKYLGQPDHPDAVVDPAAIKEELAGRISTAVSAPPSIVLTDA